MEDFYSWILKCLPKRILCSGKEKIVEENDKDGYAEAIGIYNFNIYKFSKIYLRQIVYETQFHQELL